MQLVSGRVSLPPLSEFTGSAPGKGRKVFQTKYCQTFAWLGLQLGGILARFLTLQVQVGKQLHLVLETVQRERSASSVVPLRLSTVFSCGKMFNFVNLVHKLLNFFSLRMIRAINSPLNNKTSLRLFHTKSFLENLLKVSFKYIQEYTKPGVPG